MAFDLPTKQPTKTNKKIILDAIDTDEQKPVEAPKKKVAKNPSKKKADYFVCILIRLLTEKYRQVKLCNQKTLM